MERVQVFIDGGNLYFKLKELNIPHTTYFNYGGLISQICGKRNLVSSVYYIGAVKAKNKDIKGQELRKQQQKLFSALNKQNIKVELGFLMHSGGTFHEKGVDVKLATDLLIGAYENIYDTAIIISSDTDLIPAIRKIRDLNKNVEYIGFSHKPSLGLQKYATLTRLLLKQDLSPFIKI